MQLIRRGAGFTALLMLALASTAQEKPIAYPAKGQSAAQQRQDDGERYVWSKQSTGIDPAVLASTPLQSALIGAAGGAAIGAAIGGIAVGEAGEAGEAGKGAAIGALVGVSRGIKQKQQQEAEAARRQAMNTFYRAYGACMSGCGYSVG